MKTGFSDWRIAFVFFVFVLGSQDVVNGQEREQPNVVIFFADDLGTLDARCYGSTDLYTPNIDSLAEIGVRFTQAYAHTVCCPARAALLTGRHPQRCGVNSWTQGNMRSPKGRNMYLEEVTLAESLREAGYATALFGKWHVGGHEDYGPKKQGFDHFFGIRNGFIDNYNHYFLHGKGYHDLYEGTQEIFAPGEYFPEMITERALEFLESNQDRPFFLYFPFNIPHYPEQALPEAERHYVNVPEPRRSYGAIVTTTDHYMGEVLNKLDALGVRENTIILFSSDNGHSEESYSISVENHKSGYPKGHVYGAHGGGGNTGKWIGSKGSFLEGGIRTPAILSFPKKLPAGVVRDQIVTLMDWSPTLLELCGVEKPDVKFDGRSVLPLMESNEAVWPDQTLHFMWQDRWCVRDGDWKLICHGKSEQGAEELTLHNLADEEPEVINHAEEQPALVEKLQEMHVAFEQDVFAE